MNKITFFIGCDVSKSKLNFAVFANGLIIEEYEIANTIQSIRNFLKKLKKIQGFTFDAALICIEHTGIYNNPLIEVLQNSEIHLVIEPAQNIIYSLGLTRGKNDKLDARRIAKYAARFIDRLKVFQPPRAVVKELIELRSLRNRLIKAKVQLEVPLAESKKFHNKEVYKILQKSCLKSITAIKEDITKVEKKIDQLIDKDENLKELHRLVCSVQGIGKQIANEMIIKTNEFKKIDDPKKMACHAGVAPFPRSSGSSIKGKNKVSYKADKSLKSLLHLGAMAAINAEGELRAYYLRKTEEGKNKMSVLNAVRNKLIHRIFAVVRNKVIYQKNYQHSLALP